MKSPCQIPWRSVKPLQRYRDFFQNGGRPHFRFSKIRNFNGLSPAPSQCASLCQIKIGKQLRSYDNWTVFQNGSRPPSWNSWVLTWTTHDEHLVVLVLCKVFGWNRCSIFDNMHFMRLPIFWALCFKKLIYAHKTWVLRDLIPLNGAWLQRTPQTHILAWKHVITGCAVAPALC